MVLSAVLYFNNWTCFCLFYVFFVSIFLLFLWGATLFNGWKLTKMGLLPIFVWELLFIKKFLPDPLSVFWPATFSFSVFVSKSVILSWMVSFVLRIVNRFLPDIFLYRQDICYDHMTARSIQICFLFIQLCNFCWISGVMSFSCLSEVLFFYSLKNLNCIIALYFSDLFKLFWLFPVNEK